MLVRQAGADLRELRAVVADHPGEARPCRLGVPFAHPAAQDRQDALELARAELEPSALQRGAEAVRIAGRGRPAATRAQRHARAHRPICRRSRASQADSHSS